jgi:hypothetical protein
MRVVEPVERNDVVAHLTSCAAYQHRPVSGDISTYKVLRIQRILRVPIQHVDIALAGYRVFKNH